MKIRQCDILVVGGGGAALRAAMAAKEQSPALNVLLATKGVLGKSGVTALACSDRMAFHATLDHTEPGGKDAWRFHADDIYRIGGKVSDHDLAEILARGAKEAFSYLDALDVPFIKKNGLADQFVTDGSEYARACYTGPKTAVHIEEGLLRKFRQLDIDVIPYCMIAKLIVKQGRIAGAIAIDTREADLTKAVFMVAAPAVIIATGGGGVVYEHNVFPAGMTGDGYAMAYEAGAELVNMEFIQIGIASTKTKFNCSGSMMRAIPCLVNDAGEEFLPQYFSAGTTPAEVYNVLFKKGASWPVSYEHKTHIIDIALYKETMAGRKVYLDYSRNPQGFRFEMLSEENQARYRREMTLDLGFEMRDSSPLSRLMEINQASIDWFLDKGIDLTQGEMIEVAACAQHFQGGIKIDKNARTCVDGLWAVGEAAGGQHGANRPGGNALMDCQVFGKIAGVSAAEAVPTMCSVVDEQEFAAEYSSFVKNLHDAATGDISSLDLRRELQRITESGVSIVRTADGLRKGLDQLSVLKSRKMAAGVPGYYHYLENKNMLLVSEMVMAAALERDESRGPHLRFKRYQDHVPVARSDAWGKYIVIRKGSDGMLLEIRQPKGSQ